MLYISVTFDYELFMGENYVCEKEVLIDPAEKIGETLAGLGISATFFADVCCPMQYRALGFTDFPEMFDAQLRSLARQGQDIQLHIHPNWLTATQLGSEVAFDRASYRIHNWADGDNYEPVRQLVSEGKAYLTELLLPIRADYRCMAFRAGGYCLQPEKKLIPILYEAGIRIDSSICRGFAHDGDGMLYDYKEYPKRPNLFLNGEYGLTDGKTAPITGGVFEVPVEGFAGFPLRQIASRLNARISEKPATGYGMSLENKTPVKQSGSQQIHQILHGRNMLTFDFYNARSLIFMLSRMSRAARNTDTYISMIAHPKSMSDDHIANMKEVIERLTQNPYVEFVSMRQIAGRLGL